MQYASKPEASLEGLKEELARFEAAYGAAPPLAAKWKLLSDFLRGTYAGIQAGLVQRGQQAAREQAASAQRRAAELERSAQQASPSSLPSLPAISRVIASWAHCAIASWAHCLMLIHLERLWLTVLVCKLFLLSYSPSQAVCSCGHARFGLCQPLPMPSSLLRLSRLAITWLGLPRWVALHHDQTLHIASSSVCSLVVFSPPPSFSAISHLSMTLYGIPLGLTGKVARAQRIDTFR